MKFLIKGDTEKIIPALETFCDVSEKEWSGVVHEKKDSVMMKIGKAMPVPVDSKVAVPETVSMTYYKEKDNVIFVINIYVPKVLRIISKFMRKKFITALEEYFREVDVKAKVEFLSWN